MVLLEFFPGTSSNRIKTTCLIFCLLSRETFVIPPRSCSVSLRKFSINFNYYLQFELIVIPCRSSRVSGQSEKVFSRELYIFEQLFFKYGHKKTDCEILNIHNFTNMGYLRRWHIY